jgi:hypothetical protein
MATKLWFSWVIAAAYRFYRRNGKTGADERLAEHLQPDLYPASAGRDRAETWVTRKPTADHVTSLELFAADGTQIAQLYGQRTEGEPEQKQWRSQIDALTPKGLAA